MGRAKEDQPDSSLPEGCCCGPLFHEESRGIRQVSQVCAHMHSIAQIHVLDRSMSATTKNTPSKHHPRKRNVTTSMSGIKIRVACRRDVKQSANKSCIVNSASAIQSSALVLLEFRQQNACCSPADPPRWPSGKGDRLESGRSRVRIPLAPRFFRGSSHTSDLQIGTPVATLPGAWCYRVSAGTGWPGVSIL